MTKMKWSEVQLRRLKELDAAPDELDLQFENSTERNQEFHALETKLIRNARSRLKKLREENLRPCLCRLENDLIARVEDTWWHETIRLYAAQVDATNIVRACLNKRIPSISFSHWKMSEPGN